MTQFVDMSKTAGCVANGIDSDLMPRSALSDVLGDTFAHGAVHISSR